MLRAVQPVKALICCDLRGGVLTEYARGVLTIIIKLQFLCSRLWIGLATKTAKILKSAEYGEFGACLVVFDKIHQVSHFPRTEYFRRS